MPKQKAEPMRGLRFKDEKGLLLSVTDATKSTLFQPRGDKGAALTIEDASRLHRWLGRWLEARGEAV